MAALKKLIKSFTVFFLGFSLFVAVGIIALSIAIPILGGRKTDIEHLATQIIQHPVKIESSKGIWLEAEPGLILKNLVIFDEKSMQPTLKISELQIGFKIFASLWQKKPVLGYLSIDGANIKVQQDANNKIAIVGLSEMNQQSAFSFNDLSKFFGWITSEPEIKLDHIVIDWQKPDGAHINIPYFAFTLHHHWTEHRGNLKIRQTNIGALLKEYTFKNWQVSAGQINTLNLHWGLSYQALKYLKGSMSADNLTIRSPNSTKPLTFSSLPLKKESADNQFTNWQFKSLSGRFLWRGKINDQWLLKLQRLQFTLDGQNWTEKNLQINALPIKKGGCLYTVHVSHLHLPHLWSPLTKLRFLSPENQTLIKQLNPQGDFKNIYLEYPCQTTTCQEITPPILKASSLDKEPTLNWKFVAEIHDLAISPWQKIPGIQQLSGYLQISNEMGQLRLDSEKLKLTFPKLFRSSLIEEHAQANIDWRALPTGYKINAANVEVDNSDAKFKGEMNLWLPQGDQSPFMNLFGEFTVYPNARISLYLPTPIIKPHLLKWFDQAFPSMAGISGNLVLRGPLKNFPFPNKEGIFAVHAQVNDLTLRYLPDWPVITHLFAKLNFDGPKMTVFIHSGKIFSSQIKSAYAEIPVILRGTDALLHVKTDLVGDLRDGSRFIAQSPLNKKFGEKLGLLKIDGDSEIKLNLDINLENDKVPTRTHGNIDMSEARVGLPFKQLAFENISGILHFTQDGIQTSHLQAEFLHDPITVHIKNDQNRQTLFQFSGKTRLLDLQKALGLPRFPSIEGNFTYQTKFTIPDKLSAEPNQLLITSNLKGIKANLPAPFGKAANDSAPSQVLINFAENEMPNMRFKYADKLNGILQYRSKDFDFDRGNISIGTENAQLPDQAGLWINGSLPDFNWEEWKKFFQRSQSKKNSPALSWPKILKQISLHLQNTQLFQQNFQDIQFNLSRTENSWLLGLLSSNIVGQLTIPDEEETAWHAHFEKLYLQTNASSKSNLDPADIPQLNFFAHDFRYGNKQFGQVQLSLEPADNGLKIQRLATQSPAFSVLAQGYWQKFPNRHYTHLAGQATTDSIGRALMQLGMPARIVGKSGKLLFNLEWSNPPYDPHVKLLSGHFDIALDNGRIIDVGEDVSQKIGLGELLNFFSLQNLPRHLTLDFSDISKQGFPFDIMRGHFLLKNGSAYTNDAYWDGPVAHVSMKGNISLANENYDLYLSVTPHITSSLPVVATIAGGPVVGLTTWVADKLLSKQVGKLMTYSYHMRGPWNKASLTEA